MSHHHHRYGNRRRVQLLPRWLLRLTGASFLLSCLFLVRACLREHDRGERWAAEMSDVQDWARDTGAGQVMLATLSEEPFDEHFNIVEGLVYLNTKDSASAPVRYRWVCARDGRVVDAFQQAEVSEFKTRKWARIPHSGH